MSILYRAAVCGVVLTCLGLWSPTVSRARDPYDPQSEYQTRPRLSDADRRSFEEFLAAQWRIADQLYQNPDLMNDRVFLSKNLPLRRWLVRHPAAARIIRADPRAVLWRNRESRDEDDSQADMSDRDLQSWEEFLDANATIADDLQRNPALLNNAHYIRQNRVLGDWLYDHPEAARIIKADPLKYARRDDIPSSRGPVQPTAEEVREFEDFLNREWEIADALYREPELINDRAFLRDTPVLAQWLREHPRMARALSERPRDYLWRQRGLSIDDFLRQLLTPRPQPR